MLANAGQFGGDPVRVAVTGESGGGNLATNVAILARDQKVQAPVHMLIVYRMAGTNMTTPSYIANQNAMPLSKGAMLAERLKAAGVPTTYKNYEGVTHEFFGMGAVVPEADAAEDLAARDLKAGFASGRPSK